MDPNRMRKRCPQAVALCKAFLPGFKLSFHHTSRRNGGAVADAIPSDTHLDCVWGVLWSVPDEQWGKLCAKEGYDVLKDNSFNTYIPQNTAVKCLGVDGGEYRMAWTFFINTVPLQPLPTKRYLRYMYDGAREFHFPLEYRQMLLKQPTID